MSSGYAYDCLIVEDDTQIRKNYAAGLRFLFQNVYEARDGLGGYKYYLEKKPQILIVDIDLPNMNGLELAEKIRKKDKNSKIIILTAYTDKRFLLKAASLNLVDYLVKPIFKTALHEALMRAITELETYTIEPLLHVRLEDGMVWRKNSNELFKNNEKIPLTPNELKFLSLFLGSSKRVYTNEEIYEHVWEDDSVFSMDKIKSLVRKLRKKIPHNTIENIYGTGYKINY